MSEQKREEKVREKAVRRKAKCIRRRFLRRMHRQKYRRWRRGLVGLFAAAVLYLLVIQNSSQKLWSVKEEYTAEVCLPSAGPENRETFRLVFRLKTGEILFFHETAEIHNTIP